MGSLESDTTSLSLSRIGEGNGNPLQCSCLENPRDGEAWWAAPYGVAQSWTGLKRLSSSSSSNWWSWTPFHIFICYLNILCFEMLLQIFYLFFHYVVFFMLIYGEYICVYILSPFREREIKYLFFFFNVKPCNLPFKQIYGVYLSILMWSVYQVALFSFKVSNVCLCVICSVVSDSFWPHGL